MTHIRDAKRGDCVRWVRFGRWVFGQIMDVIPPTRNGEGVGGFIIDYDGKCLPLSMDLLINNQAQVTSRGICE